jgi:hypothetical protein
MWLTAKNAPLWHFGYIYTRGGGMAHAWVGVVVLIIYKKFYNLITVSNNLLYSLGILYNNTFFITVSNNGNRNILKFFFRV